jgi:hypothetical protein
LKSDEDGHLDDDSFSYNGLKTKKVGEGRKRGPKDKNKINNKKIGKNGE